MNVFLPSTQHPVTFEDPGQWTGPSEPFFLCVGVKGLSGGERVDFPHTDLNVWFF